jgi:hypothetical protein
LRATAVNRVGARLVGIRTELAGSLSFFLAASIGTLSGILIGPITTIYYDTGFLIGLKGFVGAILGGMASYPLAVAGSIFLGLLESYASFFARSGNHRLPGDHPAAIWPFAGAFAHNVEEEKENDPGARGTRAVLRGVSRHRAADPRRGTWGHDEQQRPGDDDRAHDPLNTVNVGRGVMLSGSGVWPAAAYTTAVIPGGFTAYVGASPAFLYLQESPYFCSRRPGRRLSRGRHHAAPSVITCRSRPSRGHRHLLPVRQHGAAGKYTGIPDSVHFVFSLVEYNKNLLPHLGWRWLCWSPQPPARLAHRPPSALRFRASWQSCSVDTARLKAWVPSRLFRRRGWLSASALCSERVQRQRRHQYCSWRHRRHEPRLGRGDRRPVLRCSRNG